MTDAPDDSPQAALALEADEDCLRLAEAFVFANGAPVGARALGQILPDSADPDVVIAALRLRYAGRGVELVDVGGGVQFRSAPDLAPRLRRVVEVPRRLPRVAMETLAIIAYHQPVTRAEIEETRGTSLSQQTLDALLEAGLVAPKGRRESPGRPTLWGTTPAFLAGRICWWSRRRRCRKRSLRACGRRSPRPKRCGARCRRMQRRRAAPRFEAAGFPAS
jgi:segregation and condensation protein B